MKIQYYVLKNIQSWDINSTPIPLSSNDMNVLIAPSETGKSVIVKIIKEMCFSGKWGYTWESLIRRGEENGAVAFVLENKVIVTYHIWRNKVRYAINYNDGSPAKIWEFKDKNHTEIPEEVAELMGLIVDRKGKTVINVLDKDMVTPFVTAPPELNARIASVITVVPDMEVRRDNLEVWKEQLEVAYKNAQKQYSQAYTSYKNAPEIDVLDYQLKLNALENFIKVMEPVERMYNWLNGYVEPIEPKEVTCPNLDHLITVINSVDSIVDLGNNIVDLHKPTPVEFDEKQLDNIVKCMRDVDDISMYCNKILTTLKPVCSIDDISLEQSKNIVDFLAVLADYGKAVKGLIEIHKPMKVSEPPVLIESILNIQKYIARILYDMKLVLTTSKPEFKLNINSALPLVNISRLIQSMCIDDIMRCYDKLDEATFNVVNIENEIDNLRKEMGVCPTCGKPW